MSSIKALKKKIKSTKGTLKITSAMKLVSAAKLARSQTAIINARPYAEELSKTVDKIALDVGNFQSDFFGHNESNHSVIIVISSNRGLCGGYNHQLAETIKKYILDNSDHTFELKCIGKKGFEILGKDFENINLIKSEHTEISTSEFMDVLDDALENYKQKKISQIFIAYNLFQSSINFLSTVHQVLPLAYSKKESNKVINNVEYVYRPSPVELLEEFFSKLYFTVARNCLLESFASEHSARMLAMDSATNNCKDAIRTLTLEMNKKRQASITKELSEVVSGAEAQKN